MSAQHTNGRPGSFEFAMEFLGDPEATEIRTYVESVEAQRDELLAALREVLKHEKWHAAVADEVTPEARMAIEMADAAIAKAGGLA